MCSECRTVCARSVCPHLRVLRAIGFCRGAGRRYHTLVFLAINIYVLQQLLFAYQVRGDMEHLSQVLFLALCHLTCVAKQIIFHVNANGIVEMIAALDEPLLNQCVGGGGAQLERCARGASRLLRVYAGCALATCALWTALAALLRARGDASVFPFWTGVNYDGLAGFASVLVYSFYSTCLVAVGNTTMDAFIVTVLLQCKTQLGILRMNFETLYERVDALQLKSSEDYSKVLNELFVECLVHYMKIAEMCAALQRLFEWPLLFQFGVGGWILCIAAYRIVDLHVLSIEFASTTMFMSCILTELFLFCYFGNEVTVESGRVSQDVYSMEWTRSPPAFRRSLVLVMERAKRPLRPAAGLVIPLSLDTYVKILKSSYSFYAVLRQTKSLCAACVVAHVRCLRWCGFWRAAGRAHRFYRAATLTVTATYLLQECVYAYQVRQDMDKLSRVMFLLLCHITSIVKQLVFCVRADQIERMVAQLDEPLYNDAAQSTLLRVTAARATRFQRAYAGCAVTTCLLWSTFPVMHHLRGQPVEFPFWMGFECNRTAIFIPVLAYSFYVTTLVGIANTTMDAFMATLLHQCKTQLRILRSNFETLPQRVAAEEEVAARAQGRGRGRAVWRRMFLRCLAHHNKIIQTVKMIEDVFGGAILVQFGIGGWILCMAAYKIVSLSVVSVEFASMALFISCILTELFLYCYYGNEVTDESGRVSQSVYSMEWTRSPPAFRRSLVLVMERAKRPLRPAAGIVIPLSLDTFVKIIKSSYTFYAVLRQTK